LSFIGIHLLTTAAPPLCRLLFTQAFIAGFAHRDTSVAHNSADAIAVHPSVRTQHRRCRIPPGVPASAAAEPDVCPLPRGGCDDNVSYSPPFDDQITRLLRRAEAGGPGDAAPTAFEDDC
jgi:hypothetical protein